MSITNQEDNTPIIKKGAIPYWNVTLKEAQQLSSRLSTDDDKISSLMFGIQWDLVLKFIETKTNDKEALTNSTSWGNYSNSVFNVPDCEFYPGGRLKTSTEMVLLQTGIVEQNNKLNIFDLAGNLAEWTLEKSNEACTIRGGTCVTNGASGNVCVRGISAATDKGNLLGFRTVLY